MKQVYPEQQPIILDLSMNYCWGQSDSIRNSSKDILEKFIRKDYPIESICSATNPFRWDDLHDDPKIWEYSSPIIRITGDDDTVIKFLVLDWLSIIANHPIDWLQVRLLLVGPALFMSNSFVNDTDEKSGASFNVTDLVWSSFMVFANLLDKIRFTSMFIALVISFLGMYLTILWNLQLRNWLLKNYLFSLLVLALTLTLTVISFLAPNGRYVLPYILLNFLLLYRALVRTIKLSPRD
jgi:hypothetical protein